MTFKMKRGVLTASAEATADDFIIVEYDHSAAQSDDAWDDELADAITPMEQLEAMEHAARMQNALQTVAAGQTDILRPPQGAYVHYIPQFYLH